MDFWAHKPNETRANGPSHYTYGLRDSPLVSTGKFGAKGARKGLAEPKTSLFGPKFHRPVDNDLYDSWATYTSGNHHREDMWRLKSEDALWIPWSILILPSKLHL